MSYVLLLLIIICQITVSTGTVKARVNLAGFQLLNDLGRQLVIEEGPKLTIPEFETKNAKAWDLAISDFEAPNFDFNLAEDGLHWRSSGGKVKISGRLRIQKRVIFKIRKTGNVRGTASDLNMDLSAKMVNMNGKPQIRMVACSADLNHISIRFHGSGLIPKIVNMFHKKFEKAAQKSIREKACELAQKALETQVNRKLMEMSSQISLPKGFAVDYALHEDPIYTRECVEANLNAMVLHGTTTCPQKARRGDWDDPGPNPRMATLWIGEDVIECFLSSAHQSGVAKYLLTKENEQAKDYLKTTCPPFGFCAGMFFPDLSAKYPNQSIEVLVYSYKNIPESRFDANGVWLKGTLAADICINGQCEQKDVLARIVLEVGGYLHPEIKDNRFTGSISNVTLQAQEEFSKIGNIPPEFLSLLSSQVSTIEGIVNPLLVDGLSLPSIKFKQFVIGTTQKKRPESARFLVKVNDLSMEITAKLFENL